MLFTLMFKQCIIDNVKEILGGIKMIFDKLKEIIKDELGFEIDGLTLKSTLEDMGADSLDAVELIMAIEEAYDIEIDETDAQQFTSLENIVSYIESKI